MLESKQGSKTSPGERGLEKQAEKALRSAQSAILQGMSKYVNIEVKSRDAKWEKMSKNNR